MINSENKQFSLKKAFSLPEVMIAASVLVLTCTMVYLLFANCIILNQFNRERTLAMSHAEYVLEEIKNADFYGDPPTTPTLEDRININGEWNWNTAAIAAVFDPGSTLTLVPLPNEDIDTDELGADPDLLDIRVAVSWQDSRGANRSVSVQTLVADW